MVEPPCERNVNSVALLPGESLRSKVPPFLRSLPPPRREHASRIRRKREGWRFKVGIVGARRLFRTVPSGFPPFLSLSQPLGADRSGLLRRWHYYRSTAHFSNGNSANRRGRRHRDPGRDCAAMPCTQGQGREGDAWR